jgi:hypothetical protein
MRGEPCKCPRRRLRTTRARSAHLVVFGVLTSFGFSDLAWSKDKSVSDVDDDDAPKAAAALPNIYLDLRTSYSTVPADALSIGFGGPGLLASLPIFTKLATLATSMTTPTTAQTPSSPSSQIIGIDFPLTVDITDSVSIYGGVSASTSRTDISTWTSLAISSWNVGVQADVYEQNGGSIPTITLQSTVTRSIPDSPVATTSLNTIVEFDYALNEDETKGLLAGVQYTRVAVDSTLATVNSNFIGYVGAYYQWPNNWKLTGRAGIQSFGGAQLGNLAQFQPFTQPIVRVDLDRMDDNDNRLFGVTAQIGWVPKPSYQLIVRTPLYAVRN